MTVKNMPANPVVEELRQLVDELQTYLETLETRIYVPLEPIRVEAWISPEPLPFDRRKEGVYRELKIGERWGELYDCAWFRISGKMPSDYSQEELVVRLDFSGEGLLVDSNGEPLRGLTSVTTRNDWPLGMWGKRILPLDLLTVKDGIVSGWIDCGCNDLEGNDRGGKLLEANISRVNVNHRRFYYDLFILLNYCKGLMDFGPESELESTIPVVHVLKQLLESESQAEAEYKAAEYLTRVLKDLAQNAASPYKVRAVGHAHIDLLFTWPPRETLRKGARTYSTVLDLMKRYPDFDYRFICSQAQMYQWMQQHYPGLFSRILDCISTGRWEPAAAMWVESDVNLPYGESLIRQFLYGQAYSLKTFGRRCDIGFLPDAFGFPAGLPQIMRQSGVRYFLTQKLSQSLLHKFPHCNFTWVGLDGSSVLCHFLPEDTYSSQAIPWVQLKAVSRNKQKEYWPEWVELFGVGDGGGGPGPEHLERLIRQKKLAALPQVSSGTLQSFFEGLATVQQKLPVHKGELYFEKHQGTYTSLAKSKWYNYRCEQALHDLEFVAAACHDSYGMAYPRELLQDLWQRTLVKQFHDCLTGTSIDRVYQETWDDYEEILKEIEGWYTQMESNLKAKGSDLEPMVLNTLGFARREWIHEYNGWLRLESPGPGWIRWPAERPGDEPETVTPVRIETESDGWRLSNEWLQVSFDARGCIHAIAAAGCDPIHSISGANQLKLYRDEGDAWDLNKVYHWDPRFEPDKMYWHQEDALVPEIIEVEAVNDSPCAGLKVTSRLGETLVEQLFFLTPDSRRLDVRTRINFADKKALIRVAFPWDMPAEQAYCGCQFGEMQRHFNRGPEEEDAAFEYAVHDYVAWEKDGQGIALLTGSKYGISLREGMVSMSLLRSVDSPSHYRDLGEHEFTYALYPYRCGIDGLPGRISVRRQSMAMRFPLRKLKVCSKWQGPFVDRPEIFCTALKISEQGEETIVRLFNATEEPVETSLLADGYHGFRLLTLLEDEADDSVKSELLNDSDGCCRVRLAPLGICTVGMKRININSAEVAKV